MPFRIPPHVAWPAFVIALFGAGTVSTLSMVWIADSDGGAQVVEDYYEKAVAWDVTAARQAASDALGWKTVLAVAPRNGADNLRTVRLTVTDSAGRPVEGLRGTVQVFRPQYAGALFEADLRAQPDARGVYRLRLPLAAAGLWDLRIEASRDSTLYLTTLRTDVSS